MQCVKLLTVLRGQFFSVLEAVDGLVLGAVVLESFPYIVHPRDGDDIQNEKVYRFKII